VVTCYSMQMFIFLLFVGMVLSGSYPLVRPAHPDPPLGLHSQSAQLSWARRYGTRCDRVMITLCAKYTICTTGRRHAQQSAVLRCVPRMLQQAGRIRPAPPPEQRARSAGHPAMQLPGGRCCASQWRKLARSARPPQALRPAQVRSWELLDVNWTAAKTQHFRACYWMAWLLAGCFQATFLFLLLGKALLARLFAEPMELDEPIACAPAAPWGLPAYNTWGLLV
jgi:hypothetical protein